MLIERVRHLEILHGALEKAVHGNGVVVFVRGEAGVGKTVLLRRFVSELGGNVDVLWGASDPLFTPRPLGPLLDMRSYLNGPLRELLQEGAPPGEIFQTFVEFLQRSKKPQVIIIEDVHWADHATLDFIRHLGRRISALPAMLVLTFRDEDIDDAHPLTQTLGELPARAIVRATLENLSKTGVEALAKASGAEVEGLHRITGGNPFFVTEILANADRDFARVPESISEAVHARLLRLPPFERALVETISIMPSAVEPALLGTIVGADADRIAAQCVSRGILVQDETGALRFRHELARLATLERLPVLIQESLHAKVLAALRAEGLGSLSQLAHHAAGANDADEVLSLAPRAAKQAAALGAHREAAMHLHAALKFVSTAPLETAAQLYEDWAYEAGLSLKIDDDVIDARQSAVNLWRSLERVDKVGHNLRWLSRLHWYRGEAELALRYADLAVSELETVEPSAERAMAYSTRSQMHMLNDRMDEAVSWGKRAIELAEALGEDEIRVHALNNVGTALLFRDQPGGRELMEESLKLSLEHGFHEQAARVYTNLSEYAIAFRQFDLAERTISDGIAFDTRFDLDSWTHYLVGRQAQLRMEQGRLLDAKTIAEGVLAVESLTLIMRLPALLVLAQTLVRLGTPEAHETVTQALEQASATGELQYLIPARLSSLEAGWLRNDADACRHELEELMAIPRERFNPWAYAEVVIWRRRCLGADDFAGDLPAPHAAELQGEHLRAADLWEKLGLPYEAALALMQTEGAELKEALRRAISLLDGIQAQAASEKARAMARKAGIADAMPKKRRGPYKGAREHPLGLSRREQEILQLIVAGADNREIAKTLSRSPRTIEHHVSAILAKLSASNRMEVMLRVQSEPWLATPAHDAEE